MKQTSCLETRRDAGFTVYMPSRFGRDGAVPTAEEGIAVFQRACVSTEFRALAGNASSPVTQWLRALARLVGLRETVKSFSGGLSTPPSVVVDRTAHRAAYLDLTTSLISLPQFGHSNVRSS